MENIASHAQRRTSETLVAVWLLMLTASILPDILFNEFLTLSLPNLLWIKLGLLLLAIGGSFIWDVLKPTRFFTIFLVLLLLIESLRAMILESPDWQGYFGGSSPTFTEWMLGNQLLRVGAALLMIGMLFVWRGKSGLVYVKPGRLHAEVQPIPLLGIKAGEITWVRFGWLAALAIGAGTAVFLFANGTLQADALTDLLPLMPFVLLFAAMNAFAEEVSYRAALLAPLKAVVSPHQAVMLTALFFGIAHFYGVPYGVLGVVMATILGWLLSKSMIETEGIFWPWVIHFVQDVLIFSFMALGFVVPGG